MPLVFKCNRCPATFSDFTQLVEHWKTAHRSQWISNRESLSSNPSKEGHNQAGRRLHPPVARLQARCQRCGGNVIRNVCLQCGAEHDNDGNLIPTIDGNQVKRTGGYTH